MLRGLVSIPAVLVVLGIAFESIVLLRASLFSKRHDRVAPSVVVHPSGRYVVDNLHFLCPCHVALSRTTGPRYSRGNTNMF